jgi:hypothetical protein
MKDLDTVSNAIGLMFTGIVVIMLLIFPFNAYYEIFKMFGFIYLGIAFICSVDPEIENFILWPSLYLFTGFFCLFLSLILNIVVR